MTVQFRFDQNHTGNTNSHYTKCSIIDAFLSFFERLAWQITLYFILLTCVRCNSKTSWISENDWPKCVSVSWIEFELIRKSSTFVWNFQNFGQASEIETCYDQDSNESTWNGTEHFLVPLNLCHLWQGDSLIPSDLLRCSVLFPNHPKCLPNICPYDGFHSTNNCVEKTC